MRRKAIKLTIISVLILAAGFGGYTLYYYRTVELPDMELREARDRIVQAKQASSDKFSPQNLDLAETYYDSAITEWEAQNKKLFFLREHDRVKALAILSASYASHAIEASNTGSAKMKNNLGNRINRLNGLIDEYNLVYAHIPQSERTQKAIFKGRLLMSDAYKAYTAGDLHRSEEIVDEAGPMIEPAIKSLKKEIQEYFSQVPRWQEMVKSALKKNSSGKVLIVVDKYAHRMQVYKGSKLLHTYRTELGPNWIGNKRYRGDNATPEGVYHVKTKKSGRETKYYKALLIDYPNAEDKKRFEAEKRSGSLPRGAKIGSLIEIHGDGGKGVDWTNGCVALKNAEMDVVFGLAGSSTTIIIVGSLKSLEEIKNTK